MVCMCSKTVPQDSRGVELDFKCELHRFESRRNQVSRAARLLCEVLSRSRSWRILLNVSFFSFLDVVRFSPSFCLSLLGADERLSGFSRRLRIHRFLFSFGLSARSCEARDRTQMSSPGVEPGLSRPQRDVLTTRRCGRLTLCGSVHVHMNSPTSNLERCAREDV